MKKDRALLLKDQQILDRKKDTLGFFQLLFWQSAWVLFGLLLLVILISILSYMLLWDEQKNNTLSVKVFLSCFILIFIGYSSYTTIFIRANQHPRINENNPDNLDRALSYINRDQYGAITSFNPAAAIKSSNSGHWKRWTTDKHNPTFKEKLNFVWDYQIKEMYLRYFAWQFIGRSDKNEKPWLIFNGENVIGKLTSVAYSPRLKFNIGLGLVCKQFTKLGTKLLVQGCGENYDAEVVPIPFLEKRQMSNAKELALEFNQLNKERGN